MKAIAAVTLLACLACSLTWPSPVRAAEADWPMLAHDPARSGSTTTEVRPPFERKWYRLFPDEGLMAGVQTIIYESRVFIGTMGGRLHAIDAETGSDAWVYEAGGPILHSCAAAEGKVFFGCADGKVCAVNAADGASVWAVQTGAAVWNSPAVHGGVVLIGSRDGKLYAIGAEGGEVRWAAPTDGPLLCSPAVDARAGRVYVGSEDMNVYAFDLQDGARVWRSDKLPGVSLRGYHPVVAPDGSVIITVTPGLSQYPWSALLGDMAKEVFGDIASWRHTKEENERLRRENLELLKKPETYQAELDYLRRRLAEQPAYQTFFVLDPKTGGHKFVAPIVYGESMNGTGAPPLVTPDGKVIVKYQVLLTSRYQHYSPFLNVGYLDTATGHVTPIMDQSRVYGWHDSLLLVHDEQCQLTVAGRVLVNTHQDNVNAMDLDTLVGYGEPLCQNIHEPKEGEGVGIWAHVLRGEPVPVGKEWLARGTAVYGGGSVIDTPVSVAGDSFYYIPNHEINASCALIAYRMQEGGTASRGRQPPRADLTAEEWEKVQGLPWDWDTLEMGRLKHVLEALPGGVPGTLRAPLTAEAEARVAGVSDAELDRFIWEVPGITFAEPGPPPALRRELARIVDELLSTDWRPLEFPVGKHPREGYAFFVEPTETLYTLARAYPYVDEGLRGRMREHVAAMQARGGPLEIGTGFRTYRDEGGAVRSAYDPPPAEMRRVVEDITRSQVARLYPIWLWGHVTGDWSKVEGEWGRLRKHVRQEPNPVEEDCRNGHVAGLIAHCRLAARMGDEEALADGLAAARGATRERLVYEFAHTRGGLIRQVEILRTIFARWRHLTPEVGRLCAWYAGQTHRHLMDVYVEYHRPMWWLTWNVEIMKRNECPFAFPTVPAEVFAARALILREPAEKLESLLDLPWCRADLFHVQKLVFCIEAHGECAWRDLRP